MEDLEVEEGGASPLTAMKVASEAMLRSMISKMGSRGYYDRFFGVVRAVKRL